MIVHVASYAEAKGRVVLRIARDMTPAALNIAGRIARAYDAEIDAVLIEDENLFAATAYSFSREISPSGGHARALDQRTMAREYAALRWRSTQLIEDWSSENEVRIQFRSLRGSPRETLARACAENGPWNVVVLAETVANDSGDDISSVLEGVADTTGLVLVGDRAKTTTGPTIIVVEHSEHLAPMLRIADRLRGEDDPRVLIVPVTSDDDAGRRLDGDLRLALAVGDDAAEPEQTLMEPHHARLGAAQLVEFLVGKKPALVIARGSGIFRHQAKPLAALLRRTGSTVFLTRD